MERLLSLVGIGVILGIAYLFSTDRKAIRGKTVFWGLLLQLLFALFVLKTTVGQVVFAWLGAKINRLLQFSFVGSEFLFGKLGLPGGGGDNIGFIFAFQVLPTIVFIAALFAILYYLGVMQLVVKLFAQVMTRLMGASGAESLNVAASIFMGQTEAPLTVRPYLNKMTRSELMTVMTSGMAHISGGIMGAYIAFGVEAKHLLAVDRSDPRVSMYYQPLHPAVLRAVRGVVEAARQADIPISTCGEMAAEPATALMLVGLGVKELSMSPAAIPRVKAALRGCSAARLKEVADACLLLPTAEVIEARWREELADALAVRPVFQGE